MNISLNLQAIDTIKSGILTEIAELYNVLSDYEDDNTYESAQNKLATAISLEYILARRLGISFSGIDGKIAELMVFAEENGHELEEEFSDMSELRKYIQKR